MFLNTILINYIYIFFISIVQSHIKDTSFRRPQNIKAQTKEIAFFVLYNQNKIIVPVSILYY